MRRPKLLNLIALTVFIVSLCSHTSKLSLNGNRTGCFRVLSWPMLDNFGNTETILRVEHHRVHVSDAQLGQLKPSLFDQICSSGTFSPLSPESKSFLSNQHVVSEFKLTRIEKVRRAAFPYSLVGSLHQMWFDGLHSMKPHNAALLEGIVLGYTSNQTAQDKQLFRESGLVHIMAVSGQNVAFVMMVVLGLGKTARSFRKVVPIILSLAFFAVITGMQPSVLRAVAMAATVIGAQACGIKVSRDTGLNIAIIILLLIDPLMAKQVGFQLSVGATAGIIYVTPHLIEVFLGRRFVNGISVAIGAQIGTIVPMVFGLHRFAPLSSLLYVLVEPIVGGLMIIGVSFGLLAGLIAPVAAIYGWITSIGVETVYWVAKLGADIPRWLQYGGWLIPLVAYRHLSSKRRREQTNLFV